MFRPRIYSAFTLIELLVVISIIAILAAILFPVLTQAKRQAKSVACISNMRQTSLSVSIYATDSDGYPLVNYRNNEFPALSNTNVRWFNLLEPYAAGAGVFRCPAVGEVPSGRNMALGYNYQFLGNSHLPLGHPFRSVAETSIERPSETVAFADSDGVSPENVWASSGTYVPLFHGFTIDPPESNWDFDPPLDEDAGWCWKGNRCRVSGRHNRGANVAFCDGHAKWTSIDLLMADNSLWNGTGQP